MAKEHILTYPLRKGVLIDRYRATQPLIRLVVFAISVPLTTGASHLSGDNLYFRMGIEEDISHRDGWQALGQAGSVAVSRHAMALEHLYI